jgi:cytochrome c-type biogenesis protein CcmH
MLAALAVLALLAVRGALSQTVPDTVADHGTAIPESAAPRAAAGNLTLQQEAMLKQATRKVLCPCGGCAPTLVDDCLCGTARQLKDEMKAGLLGGQSPNQLVAGFVGRYGEKFLAAPPKEGFNLLIWVFPAVAFVVLGSLFWRLLQRLTASYTHLATRTSPPSAPRDLSSYEAEIERELTRRAR